MGASADGRVIPNNPAASGHRCSPRTLRQALQRAAILSNEKYRGIRFAVKPNLLTIQSHNPEQEEAEEEVEVTYDGEEIEIGFQRQLPDGCAAAIDGPEVQIGLTDGNSSCLIRSGTESTSTIRRDADAAVIPARPVR